jgi:hypothetical protein
MKMDKANVSRFALHSVGHLTASLFGWFWFLKTLEVGTPTRLLEWTLVVLLFPVALPFARSGFHGYAVFISVFILNSVLWGVVATWLVHKSTQKRKATNRVPVTD